METMGESEDAISVWSVVCTNDIPWERSSLSEHLQTHRLTVPQYEEMFQGAMIARQIVKRETGVRLDSGLGGNFIKTNRNTDNTLKRQMMMSSFHH